MYDMRRMARRSRSEESCPASAGDGIAVLLALIALTLFSLLALYVMLNATIDIRVSDNYESQIRARYAAQSGLNHARVLLRGLDFNSLLKGPDGAYDSSSAYVAQARTFSFRNPLPWTTALTLSIDDSSGGIEGMADDGIFFAGSIVLIPMTGIAQTVPNPYGAGTATISRYFVKASDNNGEVTELARDPTNSPFADGDGTIIVRSMGVAQTIGESVGAAMRRNSVSVFEARYTRISSFSLLSPLVIEGAHVNAGFDGTAFVIDGGSTAGIGTIDTNPGDGIRLDQIVRIASGGGGSIIGGGLPNPSVLDITGAVSLDLQKSRLLDPNYLWNFLTNVVPQAADYIYNGDQLWSGGGSPYLGFFDLARPVEDSGQDPKLVLVNGSLSAGGSISGGGLLVVHGDFLCDSGFTYSGLILVFGSVNIGASGLPCDIHGGMYVTNLSNGGSGATVGTSTFSIGGGSRITMNSVAIQMAIGLLPVSQVSYREITSTIDP